MALLFHVTLHVSDMIQIFLSFSCSSIVDGRGRGKVLMVTHARGGS